MRCLAGRIASRTLDMEYGSGTCLRSAACVRGSNFNWLNIDCCGNRIGKIRLRLDGNRLTINSITIFPEFRNNGYARDTVNVFKENFAEVIADRVRYTAVPFWVKMGFIPDGSGNYVFAKKMKEHA